jgi:hypothetical protein
MAGVPAPRRKRRKETMAAVPILLVDDDRDTCASMADIIVDFG